MGLVDVPNKRCYCCKRHEMRTTGAFTAAVSNLPDSSKQLCLHLQLAVQTQDAASLHPIDGGERNISLQNVWKLRTFTSACFDHLLLRRGFLRIDAAAHEEGRSQLVICECVEVLPTTPAPPLATKLCSQHSTLSLAVPSCWQPMSAPC
jgi:hypothetical protein